MTGVSFGAYPVGMAPRTTPAWTQLPLPGVDLESGDALGGMGATGDDPRSIIRTMAASGLNDRTIAHRLNTSGIPTITGRGTWHPAQVGRVRDPAAWAAYMRHYRARRRAGIW